MLATFIKMELVVVVVVVVVVVLVVVVEPGNASVASRHANY